MPGSFKKEDLRIIKTHKALTSAMFRQLSHRSFEKITVNDLCEEALVSRATFYVYFRDKYDLLKYWLITLKDDFTNDVYENPTEMVNSFIFEKSSFYEDETRVPDS